MFRQIMLKSAFGIIFTVIAAPAFAQNGGGGGGGVPPPLLLLHHQRDCRELHRYTHISSFIIV